MRHTRPLTWTAMIPRVRGVIAARTAAGSTSQPSSSSRSTGTGIAPAKWIDCAAAMKAWRGQDDLVARLHARARRPSSIALVQSDRPIACLTPRYVGELALRTPRRPIGG